MVNAQNQPLGGTGPADRAIYEAHADKIIVRDIPGAGSPGLAAVGGLVNELIRLEIAGS